MSAEAKSASGSSGSRDKLRQFGPCYRLWRSLPGGFICTPVALFGHFPLWLEQGDLLPSFRKLHVRQSQFALHPLLRYDEPLSFRDQALLLC